MIADEPIVTEGPGVYPEDETVATKDLPYAMKLYRWLNEHGARVSYRAIEGGSLIGALGGTMQLVTRKELPEEMGKAILMRIPSGNVEFIELAAPRAPHIYTAVQRYGYVYVRHVVGYSPGSDDFRQRWVVLVRAVS